MQFIIHFTYPNGADDSIGVTGSTIEDVRTQAKHEMQIRGIEWDNPQANIWSERVD